MVSVGGITQSLLSNWVTIAVTALATGVTLYFTRRYQTNAREERLNQAKENVISVVEEHIIDDKELCIDKFDDLIRAAERKHSVPLSDNVTKDSLLEDLELKIERSSHLNSEQKQKYTNQIRGYISKIEEEEKDPKVDRELQEILENISDNIQNENTDAALSDLDSLKDKISQLEEKPPTQIYYSKEFRKANLLVIAITIFITWFFVFNELFNLLQFRSSPITMIILIMAMIIIIFTKIGRF